jgi:putative tricarboxylic transport membrane protein
MLFIFIGVTIGIIVGGLPGLTATMAIALTLPLTFYMKSSYALILLVSMYVGGISGGLITATLLRIPGTPASIMTTLDGFPMAKGGRPGRAIGFGIISSFIGGLISWFFLAFLSPPIANFAVKFGHFEYFSLTLMALVLIASVTEGSFVKGILSGFLGILVALPGLDPISAEERLTWEVFQLMGGFQLLPVLIGVFGINQIIRDISQVDKPYESIKFKFSGIFMTLDDYRKQAINLLRSSIIGTWIGVVPGVGGNIGSIISYTVAKNASRHPEKFGKGCDEGIVASEAANNATICGALIPLITMGIPGSVVDAVLLGALIIHKIQPGPLLFRNNPEIVYSIIHAALIANFMMLLLMIAGTKLFARVTDIPKAYLHPVLLVFCFIGTYAVSNRFFDIWVMLAFGVVGYFLESCKVPLGPFVIGLVLAPISESTLRSGLMQSGGSFLPLIFRPISCIFILISILSLVYILYREIISKKKNEYYEGKNNDKQN